MNIESRILKSDSRVILCILTAALTVYAWMLQGPFKTMDDPTLILNNPHIRDVSHIGEIFHSQILGGGTYYRPLLVLYYMFLYQLFGPNAFYFNLGNLLLHAAVAASIFFLVSRMLESRPVGWWAAILFVIHPLHWEVVSMNLTDTILEALFYINAFQFFWLSNRGNDYRFYVLSLIFFCLALLSKESAVTLPLVIVSGYILFLSKTTDGKKDNLVFARKILPFFAILFVYALYRWDLGPGRIYHWNSFREIALAFAAFVKYFFTDFCRTIFPFDPHFYRIGRVFQSFADPQAAGWLVLFVGSSVFLIQKLKKLSPPVVFFILWAGVTALPYCQIIPIGVQTGYLSVAERHFYLTSVAVFALLVLFFQNLRLWLIRRNIVSAKIIVLAAAGWFSFLGLTTVSQSLLASNKIAVYRQSLSYNPYNIRVRYALALAYAEGSLFVRTEEELRKILAFDPYNVRIRIALGKALCDQGRFADGIREYEGIREPGLLKELLENNLRAARRLSQEIEEE